ncbi:MAG: DUF983 domain-containing protein [Geminicoccaceae bacterium]
MAEGTPPSAFLAGLRCRCPACGAGALFRGFLQVRPSCQICGVDLSGQDSGDGPVPFVIFMVGAIVVGLALVTEVRYGLPVWLHLTLWLPLAVVLVLALMRSAKALLIALQYKHRRQDFRKDG